MGLPFIPYGTQPSPISTGDLDATFAQLAQYAVVPCTAVGNNTISLTPLSGTPSVTALNNYMLFTFTAASTTTSAVTFNVAGLGALNAYLPDGATQAGNGTFVGSRLYGIGYNASLNAGAGGFIALFPSVPGSTPGQNFALASASYANQGQAFTYLQGNAAGNLAFSPISLTSGIAGNLSTSFLNSGQGASASTFWGGDGAWHPKYYFATTYQNGIQTLASQRFMRHTATLPFTLPVSLSSSAATSDTSALSAAVYTIKNAVAATPNSFSNCGTITFASGAQTGAFSFTTQVTLNPGDVLAVDGPVVPNSTLTGLSISIVGTLNV